MISFDRISEHEEILMCNDRETGLKAIIAIHDTTLGPGFGGCRMHPYKNEQEAVEDVLRLSKGMTDKCAAADVDFGGGKAVIVGDPLKDKSPELFRALGRFVQSLGGRFYTGTDMGTLGTDFVHASKETSCIVGLPEEYGGSGDSAVPTAYGVVQGIRAVNQFLWETDDLDSRSFAVQGLGKVGFKVAKTLLKEGSHVYVCDVYEESINLLTEIAEEETAGTLQVVEAEEIYSVNADVFVPCAIGGILNDKNIDRLQVQAICGSSNNQLLEEEHGHILKEKGILYAPDYIVNAGGLIQVADELQTPNPQRVLQKTTAIYETILEIFKEADKEGISTVTASNQLVEQRMAQRARLNSRFNVGHEPKWDIRR